MAYEGHALARNGEEVVFVEYGLPGESVVAELFKRQGGVAFGRVVEVLEASPHRIEAPCQYFGICGGCHWQHITYEHQLELKRHVVAEQLRRIGKFAEQPVNPVVRRRRPAGTTATTSASAPARHGDIGFVRRGTHRFLPVERCLIAHPAINETRDEAAGQGRRPAPGRDARRRQHRRPHGAAGHAGARALDAGWAQGRTRTPCSATSSRSRRRPSSSRTRARPSASIEMVRERLQPQPDELLLDAYAGVGTFAALFAAGRERHRHRGVAGRRGRRASSTAPDSQRAAAWRAKSRQSCRSSTSRSTPPSSTRRARAATPTSSTPSCALAATKLVYVSCDPATLARDLRLLVDGGYELIDVTAGHVPADLPHRVRRFAKSRARTDASGLTPWDHPPI